MEILWINRDDDSFKVRIEREEDLWYLSQVISETDYIEGKTERKIDMGDQHKSKTVRKTFFLGIDVESVEYDPNMKSFRASGRIQKCPDQVSKGRYHSFNVQVGDTIKVSKQDLTTYEIKKLESATSPPSNIILVLVDRDTARFARLTPSGYDVITSLEGTVEKKAFDQVNTDDFHEQVATYIKSLVEKEELSQLVIASPGFWKENVMEALPSSIANDVILGTVSRTDKKGFNELLKRPEVQTALSSEQSSREAHLVDELMEAIREDKACYGLETTKKKVEMGAIKKLLVTENFLQEKKRASEYDTIEPLLAKVEDMDGEITILSSDEPMDQIDGLGGIAGVLRWKD